MNKPKWVLKGTLARSSRPGYPNTSVSLEVVEDWLSKVKAMGIQSIICLLSHSQLDYYSEVPGGLLQRYRESALIVAHIPITDPAHDPRGAQELEENLERIYQAFQQLPKPVLIHCSAGIDRTGRAVQYIEERLS